MQEKNKAMTYAELLLVLGVVTSISVLTVPSIKKYSQRTEYGRLAQKANLTLDQLIDASTVDNGAPSEWAFAEGGEADFMSTYIIPYAKSKDTDNSTYVVTNDDMKFEITGCTANSCSFKVDVNGVDVGTGADNVDVYTYRLDKESGVVVPTGCAANLRAEHWKYSQYLWDNGCTVPEPWDIDNEESE